MNLAVDGIGAGNAYVAPDPQFISAISLFSKSLPWERFGKFFRSKKLLNLSADEQLIMLRFLAVQEMLCLDDKKLLRWVRHQFYLFSFLQPSFNGRLPSVELYQQFRTELDGIGLLEPFRKHCQHIINEHEKRNNGLDYVSKAKASIADEQHTIDFSASLTPQYESSAKTNIDDREPDIHNLNHQKTKCCENCGSQNVVRLKPSQIASSLPNIRFLRCRFCGHTFRDSI